MNKKHTSLIFGILLIVGLVATVAYIGRIQEIRRGAFFANKKVELLPSVNEKQVGDEIPIRLRIVGVGTSGGKIDNARVVMCYDGNLLDRRDASIGPFVSINDSTNNVFNNKYLVKVYDVFKTAPTTTPVPTQTGTPTMNEGLTRCVDFTIGSDKPAVDLKNEGEIAIVHFVAKAPGTGKIKVMKDYSMVSGNNIVDPSIKIETIADATYSIGGTATPSIQPGTEPVLNFKMTFGYVKPNAKCANWKVQVKVAGKNGSTKTYDDVSVTAAGTTNSNGDEVYKGSLRLSGFDQTNNVAVFIRGPKHLFTKYGKNNQTSFYDQLDGQLNGLTADAATSPTFDFSGYSLLAGDVTGEEEGIRDGSIDGRDFSYIKNDTLHRTTVAEGQNLNSDLNGDCIAVSQDTTIFNLSLKDKQSQTY